MSNVMSSTRSKATGSSTKLQNNKANLTENDQKVQSSYLISGIISEIRPGGNAVIESSHGISRAMIDPDTAKEGDNVKVRISYEEDGTQKATIVENISNSQRIGSVASDSTSFMQYVSRLFSPSKAASNLPSYPASFSYLAPNMNQLKYGHIKVGKSINVQISNNQKLQKNNLTLIGTIISNENGVLLVNSDIGILNIYAKSSTKAGQKLMIILIDKQDPSLTQDLKNTISSFMNYIGDNISLLKQMVLYNKQINLGNSYSKLLKLSTMPHDNATLAKIFRQTSEVPASQVANWINKEIVEPFESSSKHHKFKILNDQIIKIENLLTEMGLATPQNVKEMIIKIPGSEERARIFVQSQENIINFKVEVNHPTFGNMVLEGNAMMEQKNVKHLSMVLHHASELPAQLSEGLTALFVDHISVSNIEGDVRFNKVA